jgi:hypothetical protein
MAKVLEQVPWSLPDEHNKKTLYGLNCLYSDHPKYEYGAGTKQKRKTALQ